MKTNITITINPETHPNLYNLLSLPNVIDPNSYLEDLDSETLIDINKLINAVREELGV